ncbi:MAG: hypothetical protein AAFR33_02870 [Pseudomonadota bacterium]
MLRRLPLLYVLLLAAAFAALQAFGLAHAAEHAFEDHDHGGVVCELDAVASEDDELLAPPALAGAPEPFSVASAPLRVASDDRSRYSIWPPPARGPPFFER